METLEEYVVVAQDRPEITIFRRAKGWEPEVLTDLTRELQLRSVGLSLPVAAVYDGVRS